MTKYTEDCNVIADAYAVKTENGLVDVKFLLKNKTEITTAEACSGFAQVQKAIIDGKSEALDFGDLNWE